MGLELVPTKKGKAILLNKAIVFFGRHPECDVVLKKSRKVSRKHCCIAQVDDRFVIRDLGSTNGIQVNGERVESLKQFNIGDQITIGDLEYTVQPEGAKQAKPTDKKSESKASSDQIVPASLDISQEVPIALPESNEIDIISDSVKEIPIAQPVSRDEDDEGPRESADDENDGLREDSHHDISMLAD